LNNSHRKDSSNDAVCTHNEAVINAEINDLYNVTVTFSAFFYAVTEVATV